MADAAPVPQPQLRRELGLLPLAATGICSMLGAAINILPFSIQRNVPGIGPSVLLAFALGAVPAIFAALAYAHLASAMPRAGGSYVYASRALHPALGFIASFSQWFGVCVGMGVVSYVLPNPFLRDVALALEMPELAAALTRPWVHVGLALAFVWTFVAVNVRGLRVYSLTLVPMMFLMFALGAVVIVSGWVYDRGDFAAAVLAAEGTRLVERAAPPLEPAKLMAAAAILFSSFVGFDSIAQAGGEARNPGRAMPLAFAIAVGSVGAFYLLFTASVYRVVPWSYIAERAQLEDLTAAGLLAYVLPAGWTVPIVAGAAVALINDLPAMLLATSRLMFAWAEDRIFPRGIAAVHPRFHTPHVALVASGAMASLAIVGSHLAGDFFLGADILATALLVNFLLMCLSVLVLPARAPHLAVHARFLTSRPAQWVVGAAGMAVIAVFLVAHVAKDLQSERAAWFHHPTALWILVMSAAALIFVVEWRKLRQSGLDTAAYFRELPPD
ncbi:MAG TPA: APC family permease [Thermoanaerobaculia bacterium]|nr:APC family permease [Thermoanaerobaculia bacterium]